LKKFNTKVSFIAQRRRYMEIKSIINVVLYALALAIGVIGAMMLNFEMGDLATNSALTILFVGMAFLAIAGLSNVDKK
jgi:hypothetical protein